MIRERYEGGLENLGIKKTSNEKPLISVITVVFNGVRHIEQTILSVINQSYKNIQYIIIDGGSDDGTLEIIKKYNNKIDYWLSENDEGIYDGMNKGLSKASGATIGILNADDWYEPNLFENISKFTNLNNSVLYGGVNLIDKYGISTYSYIPSDNLERLKKVMHLCHPATFIGQEVYKKIGVYDKSYKISADYKLILSAYLMNVNFIPTKLLMVNFRDGGISSNFKLINLRENIKLRSQLGIRSLYVMEFIIYFYFRLKILKVYFKNNIKRYI